MQFESEAQKTTYEMIAPWMKELFGEFVMARDEVPVFGLALGTSLTTVMVMPWGDDNSIIAVRSIVVRQPQINLDLAMYLLNHNATFRFGAFGIDSDGDIIFDHTIVGSTCDKPELRASVLATAHTVDKYDDEIVSRWGGTRARDEQ